MKDLIEALQIWDGVDRAALEVATWPDWKIDHPRGVADSSAERVDEIEKCDHNKDTA